MGIFYDIFVFGYKVNIVNFLCFWCVEVSVDFKFEEFNFGNYDGVVVEKMSLEIILKVFYLNDNIF